MSYLAEKSIIGCLMMDINSLKEIYKDLNDNMFEDVVFGKIYRELLRGYTNNYSVDAVILEQKLRDEVGPREFMAALSEAISEVGTSRSVKKYAEIIINDYKVRYVNDLFNKQLSSQGINDQIADIMQHLEILQGSRTSESKSLSEIAEEFQDNYFRDNEAERLYLGFPQLDEYIGGLEGGDVIVIGARPAVGKSAFVTQVTSHIAKQGKKVGFYNLEMKEKQVYERFVASESGISLVRLKRAVRFLGDEEERFRRANRSLKERKNIILTTGSKSAMDIKNECKHMGYDLLIIDYMQLIRADATYKGNRYAEVGAISKAIKGLAMDLNIPIILLSQLNRISTTAGNKEPTMAELRESGDIEQDASVIILLWDTDEDDYSKKGCKIEKNRQGECGKVYLQFDGEFMRFKEVQGEFKKEKKKSVTPFD